MYGFEHFKAYWIMEYKNVENNIYMLSRDFAIRIIKLFNYLKDQKKKYIMSKHVFKSGTSVGANVFEAKNAQSRADFSSKMNIALKEMTETLYWLDLLHTTEYIDEKQYDSIFSDGNRIMATLIKIVKATKSE